MQVSLTRTYTVLFYYLVADINQCVHYSFQRSISFELPVYTFDFGSNFLCICLFRLERFKQEMFQIQLVKERFMSFSPFLETLNTLRSTGFCYNLFFHVFFDFTFLLIQFLHGLQFYMLFLIIQLVSILGCSGSGEIKTAFVTFKDPKALEIALLLSVCHHFVSLFSHSFV